MDIGQYTENLSDKQRMVFEILVCPIEANKNLKKIELVQNNKKKIILSGQKYVRNLDEDMSDFAISFYEILYDLKRDSILQQEGSVFDWCYAGDTMNSYNTIARFASEKKKTELKEIYHCLANFWILPAEIGRVSNRNFSKEETHGKPSKDIDNFNKFRRDYMDRFLMDMYNREEEYVKKYECYYDKIKISDFSKKHFLNGIYIDEKNSIIKFSKISKGEEMTVAIDSIIDTMISNIFKRAFLIVCNKYKCDKLFDLFKDLGLFENKKDN